MALRRGVRGRRENPAAPDPHPSLSEPAPFAVDPLLFSPSDWQSGCPTLPTCFSLYL